MVHRAPDLRPWRSVSAYELASAMAAAPNTKMNTMGKPPAMKMLSMPVQPWPRGRVTHYFKIVFTIQTAGVTPVRAGSTWRPPANSPVNYSRRSIFEHNWCDLEAAEPRISDIFEVRPTTRTRQFCQKDEDASISTGC
jgi:hypothetical protein